MNKTIRMLITYGIALTGTFLPSALMLKLGPNNSWLAFVGWSIFFGALQLPWLMVPSAQSSCTAWLARFRKGA